MTQTWSDLASVVGGAMMIVEKTDAKSSDEKKSACLLLIKEISDMMPDDNHLKLMTQTLLKEGLMGDIIDLVVDASKNKLDINRRNIITATLRCFKGIISFALNKLSGRYASPSEDPVSPSSSPPLPLTRQ
jgi:hypothetical protein